MIKQIIIGLGLTLCQRAPRRRTIRHGPIPLIRRPMNGGLPASTHAGMSAGRNGKDGGMRNGAGIIRGSVDETSD
jgi:hypothetical protein